MTDPRAFAGLPPALLLAVLAGCGGDAPASRAMYAEHAQRMREPAELHLDDARLSASLAPTAVLDATVAARYGVAPAPDAFLLLVGLRRGPAHAESSVPARVQVRARDLRGVWQAVPMREVRVEGFIDYVGTVRVTPPDTLAFEVVATRAGRPPAVLRFSRDVLP